MEITNHGPVVTTETATKPAAGILHHVTLAVRDLESAGEFYTNTLHLEPLPAPPEAIAAGVRWFDLGEGRALHLIEVEGVVAPPRAHVALSVADNDAWRACGRKPRSVRWRGRTISGRWGRCLGRCRGTGFPWR